MFSCGVAVSVLVGARAGPLTGPTRDMKGDAATVGFAAHDVNVATGPGPNGLARVPPMGWMSWEVFRCETDCTDHPESCINENLYMEMSDHMASDGYRAAGYNQVSIDDCWENHDGRDAAGDLFPDATRFPSGLNALADHLHRQGVNFGIYSDEGTKTCGGYPGSSGYESVDADTFASWDVDYLKLDGCYNGVQGYVEGYPAMGSALQASGRDIVYSCSWPAYLGSNESSKPFGAMIQAGCNLWRNWADIQCNWGSLGDIIDHWGDYGTTLQQWAGPGHWHDMDMLLIGNGCITSDEERTQMAIWAISASPLIMGNDLRNVSAESAAILLNSDAIAVSQDALGAMGIRLPGYTATSSTQVWARHLSNGDVAVGLYNKDGAAQPDITGPPCTSWHETSGGYLEACGGAAGNVGTFFGLTVDEAKEACCNNLECAGFDFSNGSGYYKGNAMCGFTTNAAYAGYTKPAQVPTPSGEAADISVTFADVGLSGEVDVYDIWAKEHVGTFSESFTARNVPYHGTAFLRLSTRTTVV
mmetsp:Transcript_9473/g.26458  ORF Transcript_9473/g.26458 Transcript_9473/m.26458 type:complete len:530 (-) Transcript_9473:73-1662(-)